MNIVQNWAKGLIVLFLVLGIVAVAAPARAENGADSSDFANIAASLKADALIRLESSTGVVTGPNGAIRVLNAKVTSATNDEVKATASFGDSALNFVVKADSATKLNGKARSDASLLSTLKAGDKVSFAGTITSSSSSSITVDGDHIVSRVFMANKPANQEKAGFAGTVKSVNSSDNTLSLDLANGRNVQVALTSSTVVTVDGEIKSIASLEAGDMIKVSGELNAAGTIITASKISTVSDDRQDDNKGDNGNHGDNKGNGGFWGKIRNWFLKK